MKRLMFLSILMIVAVASTGCCRSQCGGLFGGHRLFGGGMFGKSSSSSCCESCDTCGEAPCSTCGTGGDVTSSEIILPPPQ